MFISKVKCDICELEFSSCKVREFEGYEYDVCANCDKEFERLSKKLKNGRAILKDYNYPVIIYREREIYPRPWKYSFYPTVWTSNTQTSGYLTTSKSGVVSNQVSYSSNNRNLQFSLN